MFYTMENQTNQNGVMMGYLLEAFTSHPWTQVDPTGDKTLVSMANNVLIFIDILVQKWCLPTSKINLNQQSSAKVDGKNQQERKANGFNELQIDGHEFLRSRWSTPSPDTTTRWGLRGQMWSGFSTKRAEDQRITTAFLKMFIKNAFLRYPLWIKHG